MSENSGKEASGGDGDESKEDSGARECPLLTCRFHGVMLGDAMYRALETQQDKLKEDKYVVFEREAREPHFHPSLTHSTRVCHLHNS